MSRLVRAIPALFVLLAYVSLATAQIESTYARRIRFGAANPSSCAQGELFLNTTAGTLQVCTTEDSWATIATGGAASDWTEVANTPTTLAGYGITDAVANTLTVNGKALSGNITLTLASADYANQGTTTTVLHGNAGGNPSFATIATNDIANSAVTYGKMQNVSATARLLGRNTAGAGVIEELDASAGKTVLGLGNVENTAVSTWAGSANLTTGGTFTGSTLTSSDTVTATTHVVAGATSFFIVNGRSKIGSSSNGLVDILNNAGSGLTRVNLGGTTNSFAGVGYDAVNGVTIQSAAGTATWNDASTSASGTVANRYLFGIAAPTLTATNSSVTDTLASTLYVGGAPTASTNTTIGTAYAIQVGAGRVAITGQGRYSKPPTLALEDGSPVAVDCTKSMTFSYSYSDSFTLGAPTGCVDNDRLEFYFTHPANTTHYTVDVTAYHTSTDLSTVDLPDTSGGVVKMGCTFRTSDNKCWIDSYLGNY